MLATGHAASVFTHSCLSTPRDPTTRLPADGLTQSNGLSETEETGGTSPKLATTSTGGLKSSSAERSRDDSFQASIEPNTPYYIRPATVNSGRKSGRSMAASEQFSSPGVSINTAHLDPSSVVGNERGERPSTITDTRDDDYVTLFATLLESNMLLREEIQKLREDSHKTMAAVEQLQTPHKSIEGCQPVSKVARDNTHVLRSSCGHDSHDSSLSLDSVGQDLPPKSQPARANDQHEYNLVDLRCEYLDSREESSVRVEVDPHQIDLESVCSSTYNSSRMSSPSAVHEVFAHASRSAESLLSSESLTSSASSDDGMQATRAIEGGPFASPGMLAIERMWSDFSVEDYPQLTHSYSEEWKKGEKPRKQKVWTPKITVPKPFSMTVRDSQSPKQKSRSMIQAEQERLEREAMEEAELKKQFRATPLPASTYLPLYELINAKNEHRREEVKMLSKQILKASERPFSFTKRDNDRQLMREQEMRRSLELKKSKFKEASFRAKPVPKHLFDPDVAERIKEQEEYREIRIRLRAQELLAMSKLPGNMQLKSRESSIGALRKKRLDENQGKAFLTDEHVFHPTVSSSVPDYDRAFSEFQKQLALRKRTKYTTSTKPFYLRTQFIPSRKEQILQDIQRDEELRLENRWPFTAPKAKSSSTSPKHTRARSCNVPYPSQMTKTAKVRFSLTQEKLTSALVRERALENQERQRKERQEMLKETVTKRSQSCDPTTWLEEKKQKKCQLFK